MAGIIHDIDSVLSSFDQQTPLVIFSSMAPLVAQNLRSARRDISDLAAYFQQCSKERDVLMPSFTKGYQGGAINLDVAPSSNGILTELFRAQNPRNRTTSAFFSFTAVGPSQEVLKNLRPNHVWGPGSLYEWMEKTDSTIVTVGLPPYVCSFQHRAEYLERRRISYRKFLKLGGLITIRGEQKRITETLFARLPGADVDFRPMNEQLHRTGIEISSVGGITVSAVSAKRKLELARSLIRSNGSIFLARKAD
jgi:aminoglycoside N3'-acetyltransferase